jgi:DNA modification methylase
MIDKNAINPMLFPFQRDIVVWSVHKDRAAVFLDTGLGKTFIQLEWARLIGEKTLIIAPLSVSRQTVREAKKLGIDVQYVRSQAEVSGQISITNYEMIDHFDMGQFGAVVLDESSILKALAGKTRKRLTDACENVPYRLCCTATPAPNDHIEIGNQAEFLGICSAQEMLAMFFVNANKEHTYIIEGKAYRKKGSNKGGQEWRLKHHAEEPFFRWLSSWAITMIKPSDLGYDDDGFILPKLTVTPIFVSADYTPEDQLFFTGMKGVSDRAKIRKGTIEARLDALKGLVLDNDDQWIIWCGLDSEQNAVSEILGDDCVSIYGSLDPDEKERRLEMWLSCEKRFLVSKPRVCGFGLNLQQAHKMAFFGLNDSWEAYYQCIRREWRYRQESPVDVYVILSNLEEGIYKNIMRKEAMAYRLRQKLVEQIKIYEKEELEMSEPLHSDYEEKTVSEDGWTAMLGDSCKRLAEIGDNSIDLSVYSPPFADLFTYSASERDLGNVRDWSEFFDHYSFIIGELLRVTKPGRLTCVHTSDIPAMASRDGYIGVKDFPGEVIRAYEKCGWVFNGRAFVQKNPQAQAIRTKSKALLFVQMAKDSSCSRPALVDQVLIFSKSGENVMPITPVKNGEMDNETWIEWANGIWLGIQESDTLQFSTAREADDEKHICPLQLGTIERCIKLYSNPGETILTPFGGIGSEAYQAIKFGRKAILIELKPSYFEVAVKNLRAASALNMDLFEFARRQAEEAEA